MLAENPIPERPGISSTALSFFSPYGLYVCVVLSARFFQWSITSAEREQRERKDQIREDARRHSRQPKRTRYVVVRMRFLCSKGLKQCSKGLKMCGVTDGRIGKPCHLHEELVLALILRGVRLHRLDRRNTADTWQLAKGKAGGYMAARLPWAGLSLPMFRAKLQRATGKGSGEERKRGSEEDGVPARQPRP